MTPDRILELSEHRPWPLPDRSWVMLQRWHDLLFAHWPLPAAELRPHVPRGLPIDTFDGSAWLGIVPFRLSDLRPRLLPPVPRLSAFPELNVRTYVELGGKPGVYFFSLDAASLAAVIGARVLFHLPYYHAEMEARRDDDAVRYHSRRGTGYAGREVTPERPRAEFVARYGPTGPVAHAAPGSLEHWLTERYCLYAVSRGGRVYRVDIHHPPWPLQPAEAEFEVDTMAIAAGITLPDESPRLHFAARQDVLNWAPRAVREPRPATW